MKVAIDPMLKGKELTAFLIANKSALIAQKKSMPIKYGEALTFSTTLFNIKDGVATKSAGDDIPADVNTVRVKVAANAALWCDSQMDVLIPDCWKKSIADRKGMIPHLHDHIHQIGAEVGDVVNIYSQDISLSELGLSKAGTTQALIFETDVRKAYNEIVFNKYKAGKIKQHSIGLRYVKIELAINDEDSEKEYDFWNKYYERVINKEIVDESGYFWVIQEIILLENSAVLFGSNQLTPTLEIQAGSSSQPSQDTEDKSHKSSIGFNLGEAIRQVKFFNQN